MLLASLAEGGKSTEKNSLVQPFLFAFATEACVSCNKPSTRIYIVRAGSSVWTRLPQATMAGDPEKVQGRFVLFTGDFRYLVLPQAAIKGWETHCGKRCFVAFLSSFFFFHGGNRILSMLNLAHGAIVVVSAPAFLSMYAIVSHFREFTGQ